MSGSDSSEIIPTGPATAQCILCGGALRAFALAPWPDALHTAQWECASCRLLASVPQADPQRTREYYTSRYYQQQWPDPDVVWFGNLEIYAAHELPLLKRLSGLDRPKPGATAVDVGCGYGPFVKVLEQWGFRAMGIEPSPRAAASCRGRGLRVVRGSCPGLPLREASVDLVSATHVIEHAHDPLAMFDELAARVRRGGHLVIVTDNRWTSQYAWERLRSRIMATVPRFHTSTDHTFVFGVHHIRELMRRAGFTDVRAAVFTHRVTGESLHWRAYKGTFRTLDRVLGWGPYQLVIGRRPEDVR